MTTRYFQNFPTIDYAGHRLVNLILNARLRKELLDKYSLFYPYTVKDGETPVIVSNNYYRSPDFVWLIMLANNITDFYSQWPLNDEQLTAKIEEEYGSIADAVATIDHYEHAAFDYTMSPTSYQYLDNEFKNGWTPVTAYDTEIEKNEAKRQIRLLDNKFAPTIALEIERVLNP